MLWARVAEVAGAPDAGGAVIHAVTSEPMMAQRDPWVNMLRTTLAAFGAGVGGAGAVGPGRRSGRCTRCRWRGYPRGDLRTDDGTT
ncbi:methylmalonyl-CoA mutase, small subunit [Mycobacteroides abscessus subsp. massiliense]|nr:methylmalonyl-CoA mutase, small subunit [Mycobacteroides abscessus subsp. massiliense]